MMHTFPATRTLALPVRQSARSRRALKAFLEAATSYIQVDADGTLQIVVQQVAAHPEQFGFGTTEAPR